jgi:hypothetical protein
MTSLRAKPVKVRYNKIYKILMFLLRAIIHNNDSTSLHQSYA